MQNYIDIQSESAAAEPDLFAPRFVEILCAAEGGNREPRWRFLVVAMWASRGLGLADVVFV